MKNTKKLGICKILIGILLFGIGLFLLLNSIFIETISGLLCGLGGSIIGFGIVDIVQYKNPKISETKKIAENDERIILIRNKALAKSGQVLMWLNCILNFTMATLRAPLWIILSISSSLLIYAFCIIFFTNKYNKEM